jgi:hypothetical protein
VPFVSEFGFCAAGIMAVCTYGPTVMRRLKRVPRVARAQARVQASIRKFRGF